MRVTGLWLGTTKHHMPVWARFNEGWVCVRGLVPLTCSCQSVLSMRTYCRTFATLTTRILKNICCSLITSQGILWVNAACLVIVHIAVITLNINAAQTQFIIDSIRCSLLLKNKKKLLHLQVYFLLLKVQFTVSRMNRSHFKGRNVITLNYHCKQRSLVERLIRT